VLRFAKVPSVIVRPEAIVNIQRQLEQTIGGSSKGILYLAGDRSAREGMNPFESIVSTRAPLTLANARRLMDASALLGWGRLEISLFDPENGRLVLTITNSPLARAYGPSKKPVCHFLTGWVAGLGRSLLEREVLCEETACAAQGHDRCEFELRPMGPP
jgi:predicted hydrocarbon binding protein